MIILATSGTPYSVRWECETLELQFEGRGSIPLMGGEVLEPGARALR